MKEIIDTKITDKWGVHWDEMETVRDFLQNFYDANPVEDISITIQDTTTEVSAPKTFDYLGLLYLGSHKKEDADSIGQYGEGWKAGVVNAMRNWGCKIDFIIGNKKLHYFFEDSIIGEGKVRILKCEVTSIKSTFEGSKLIVKNCTPKLLQEFEFGLNYFYYETNPLFGNVLQKTYENDIVIYQSSASEGYVFYKKLMRAKLDVPLIIVCNRIYKNIDKEIAHDRDRKAFKKEVLDSLLKYIFKNFDNRYCKELLQESKPHWEKGHWLLKLIAETRRWNDRYCISFDDNYYAHTKEEKEDMDLRLEMSKVSEEFSSLNYMCCPSYMGNFGMKSIHSVAKTRMLKRKELLNKTYTRGLTIYEKLGISILADFIKQLSPDVFKKFENAKYTVGQNDEVIGELKQKRNYHEQHIFLNTIFFTFSFNDALAILFHEWAHIYGSDGSRTFSDALTYFISMILKKEMTIEKISIWQRKWEQAAREIKREKSSKPEQNVMNEIKANLSPERMKKILNLIPDDELYKLIERVHE
ncbi:hypothetical protein [Chryseobacterium sp. SL1]|uniref:hypothetical protein n=1 Tax=Chryseobacterium sp. SL1 TaxID=2995159 RepID=UPI00227244AA|nr:hypothetical protein [Chryseobacterium sp. SL1]MCY1660131.1 hypothetical protein [Chryseobacterium sp. SL1]